MQLTDQINIRVDHDLKINCEKILKHLGMNTTDAIRIFLNQVYLTKSLPLDVKIPNKTTRKAIQELEDGKGIRMELEDFHKLLENL